MSDPISSSSARLGPEPDFDFDELEGADAVCKADDPPETSTEAPASRPAEQKPERGGFGGFLRDIGASLLQNLAESAAKGPTPAETATPATAPTPPGRGTLPDTLMRTPNATVSHGTDPGDYYCEHMFFLSQGAASAPGSSVLSNSSGERLAGFLHVPADDFTYGAEGRYTQASRHAGTREVIGAALRGYADDAMRAGAGDPVRLLLSGYDTFQRVTNNPTGDFVTHRDNIDAAMRNAYGDNLLTPRGSPVSGGSIDGGRNGQTLQYRVRDEQSGRERTIEVRAQRFPVTDGTLDPTSARSIQGTISSYRPHGVISMGVTGGSDYKAEFHADDGGLARGADGRYRHDDAVTPRTNQPDNYSLARAIARRAPGAH